MPRIARVIGTHIVCQYYNHVWPACRLVHWLAVWLVCRFVTDLVTGGGGQRGSTTNDRSNGYFLRFVIRDCFRFLTAYELLAIRQGDLESVADAVCFESGQLNIDRLSALAPVQLPIGAQHADCGDPVAFQ